MAHLCTHAVTLLSFMAVASWATAFRIEDGGRTLRIGAPGADVRGSWSRPALTAPQGVDGDFYVQRNALSAVDVKSLFDLQFNSSFGATLIADRDPDLLFHHSAYRVESLLFESDPQLYAKLVDLMLAADASVWHALHGVVHPEIEYIVYEQRAGQPLPSIEPHVDNDSVLTLIVLLSRAGRDFAGGLNIFASPTRSLALERGDAVVFRGELLEHWITPVTSGTRSVLQIELSAVDAESTFAEL